GSAAGVTAPRPAAAGPRRPARPPRRAGSARSRAFRPAMRMTVRTLVLLRHAKAERPPGVADADRPLSPRGHADAHAAGAWLKPRFQPDLILCSPSKRTRQTWQAVASVLGAAPRVRYERRLYQGD